MSRNPVHVRDATPDDVAALLVIWADLVARRVHGERGPAPSPETEVAEAVSRIAADESQRLLVAEYVDRVVAAVHLTLAAVSPVSGDRAVQLTHLHVLDEYRRRGVGRALVEATVAWAEEKGIDHVLAAASVQSRDANRFMARLGLAQIAVLRGATVSTLRTKLPVECPAAARVGTRSARSVGQVLAQRRSMRRAQSKIV